VISFGVFALSAFFSSRLRAVSRREEPKVISPRSMPRSGNNSARQTTMALPMAVPYCIWMASIAPASEGRSIVARWATCALPAKVTNPTSMCLGTSFRNALAASCAATMREGFTSATRMLREMSIASRIVDLAQGSGTGAVGRARASSSSARAKKISAGGTCRRHGRPPASRTTRKLENLSAGLPARRSSHR
jgi:hypothetical protein